MQTPPSPFTAAQQKSNGSAAPRPAIHLTYVRLLCALLAGRGIATAAALAAAGLGEADLRVGNHLVSLERLRPLLGIAMAGLGTAGLGLQLGAVAQTFSHGPVGYAALSSRDLRQALEVLTRYGRLRSQATEFRLHEAGGSLTLEVHETQSLGELRLIVLESTLVVCARLLEALLGQPLAQAVFLLPYEAPAWSADYPAYLAGEVEFQAPVAGVRLPAGWLATPCVTADARAHLHACRECEQALEDSTGDLVQRLRDALFDCAGDYPGLEAMAARQQLSARTLIRRLKDQGTSYQALLDEVRKDLAVWLLRSSAVPVEEVAARLGYVDSSNFSRTFRRWFGVTPREFRDFPPD